MQSCRHSEFGGIPLSDFLTFWTNSKQQILLERFLLLMVCLIGGVILRRTTLVNQNTPVLINKLLVYFFIPVLTLYHIPKIQFEPSLIWLGITPFIVYLSSFIFVKWIALFQQMDRQTEGALIMCSGIGSISFVGFPIFELLYGEEGLSYGVILSLAGTFVVFNTLGLYTGIRYAAKTNFSGLQILRKMIRFPSFVAFLIALGVNVFDIEYPLLLDSTLKNLSAPFSVLALLAIGMQVEFSFDKTFLSAMLVGQLHKLIVAPIMIYLLVWQFLGITDLVGKICILGAAVGSMNAISILAAQMGLQPKLAMSMPAIGIPLSIPFLFLIDMLLQ
ncbi:MAG: AEC family transporter [Bacteroidota bacterium]